MRRSKAPSQLFLNSSLTASPSNNKENKFVSPFVDERAAKKARLLLAVPKPKSPKKDVQDETARGTSRESQEDHDLSIEKILKKPFKVIIVVSFTTPLLLPLDLLVLLRNL